MLHLALKRVLSGRHFGLDGILQGHRCGARRSLVLERRIQDISTPWAGRVDIDSLDPGYAGGRIVGSCPDMPCTRLRPLAGTQRSRRLTRATDHQLHQPAVSPGTLATAAVIRMGLELFLVCVFRCTCRRHIAIAWRETT